MIRMGFSPMARCMIRANARNAQQLLDDDQEPEVLLSQKGVSDI